MTSRIERATVLDPLDGVLSALGDRAANPMTRGHWLGHALHPLLTDLPLGLWTSALALDVVGGETGRTSARRLVGLGLFAAVPTMVTGVAEWRSLPNLAARRVATVHAIGNVVVMALFFTSWTRRRAGRHMSGSVWGLAGGSAALITGFLGGHLSFARGVGAGERGTLGADPTRSASVSDDQG